MRKLPSPIRKIIGNLSNADRVLVSLDLRPRDADPFAAGNTTIVKAPPQAPASSAAVVELLIDAGMPAEAVQLLHGGGELPAYLGGDF